MATRHDPLFDSVYTTTGADNALKVMISHDKVHINANNFTWKHVKCRQPITIGPTSISRCKSNHLLISINQLMDFKVTRFGQQHVYIVMDSISKFWRSKLDMNK